MSGLLMSQLWDVFSGGNAEGVEKIASLTEDFLRDRIRETSVLNRILPPVVLTEAQIERNTANDWPLKRVEIEPDSKAFTIGFRGKGSAQFMEGKKYEVYFTKIETEHFKKTREELMTMRYPVVDVVNSNLVLDMQEQLDGMLATRFAAAVALSGNVVNTGATALTKENLVALAQTITGKRRRPVRLIMTEARWMDLATLSPDKLGYGGVERIAFNGVRAEKTFLGYEVITSINSSVAGSVWNDKNIWMVTEPQFLGSNFIIGDVQQEMKREGNMLEWWSWMDQGCEIGNAKSVGQIVLT